MKYESMVYVLGPRYKEKTDEWNFQTKPNKFHLYTSTCIVYCTKGPCIKRKQLYIFFLNLKDAVCQFFSSKKCNSNLFDLTF